MSLTSRAPFGGMLSGCVLEPITTTSRASPWMAVQRAGATPGRREVQLHSKQA